MEENSSESLCQVIFTMIPDRKYPQLRELYQHWSMLNGEERANIFLDTEARGGFHPEGTNVYYLPLINALNQWDYLQNHEGAPGCEPGFVSLSGHPQVEEEVMKTIAFLQEQVDDFNEHKKKEAAAKKTRAAGENSSSVGRGPHLFAAPRTSYPQGTTRSSYNLPSRNTD